ncbi:hypothetical protein Hamer_G030451 [Homarus americanus]|uniref:Uncharacterized protein n=1 Tax=Homarus americanus TaxID=6706 RepID=A0A8J5ML68_HOMAM|nr:hypothetical protein Hamer_G030451 [Homarus americanus]
MVMMRMMGCPVGDPRPDSGENSRHEVDTQSSNEDLDPVADSSSSSSEEESQGGLAVLRSKRATAGKHSNMLKLPQSTIQSILVL